MEFDDVILGRRSIRGYKPDPVPQELIKEILALAIRAPSSMNTQPWNFYIITGAPLDRIRQGNTERNLAGVPHSREFRTGQPFEGVHRERQVGVAKQLFSAMGIARDDKPGRQDWVLRGFRQFDAPVCVIITYDRVLASSDDTAFDCGAVATALVNAAWSRGLGAVINSQGIMQSPVVRECAGIADDQVIMKSIALGWPDHSFPANAVVSERKSVDEATTFVGFEGGAQEQPEHDDCNGPFSEVERRAFLVRPAQVPCGDLHVATTDLSIASQRQRRHSTSAKIGLLLKPELADPPPDGMFPASFEGGHDG
jgi:nitroreductase